MPKGVLSPLTQLIQRTVEYRRLWQLPDQELLQRFQADHDQAAFHSLLRRHGSMVLDVCRGVLRSEADAEDAFQATFLVLAAKVGSIRKLASIGSWLHGVALRTARKARERTTTRRKHEALLSVRQSTAPDEPSWREVREALHEELSSLPDRYRAPLVLCYLEGATQEAAAIHLGLAKSTLRERLDRARELLRARLVRRGLGPTALLLAAAWPVALASAGVPTSMALMTINAAGLIAAGQTATTGVITVKVAALTEGVLKAMFMTKLKIAVGVFLMASAIGLGVGQFQSSVGFAQVPTGLVAGSQVPGEDAGKHQKQADDVAKQEKITAAKRELERAATHLEAQKTNLTVAKALLDEAQVLYNFAKSKFDRAVGAKADPAIKENGKATTLAKRVTAEKEVIELLQGSWTLEKGTTNGEPVKGFEYFRMVFDGQRVSTMWKEAAELGIEKQEISRKNWLFSLNPVKSPAELTIYGENVLIQAIYALEGDRLTIASYGRSEVDRPPGFVEPKDGKSDLPLLVWTYKKSPKK